MNSRFEHLRHEEYPDAAPVTTYSSENISPDRTETIHIHYAEAKPGKWVGGYSVFWKNGRQSLMIPSLADGWFSSSREAKLFYLGFMLNYLEFFTEDNQFAIKEAVNKYSQSTLFE